ncbi:phosphoglycolate phosphatase [Massilia eurypsychrophila]|jgi:phosphoglycolate phosphatase|uniref:Phosphoglycolate phosphatase n=1 Tax=Massilia eurypsychrophila TaxID=1485217 RepID=A0A2G8TL75_9BURK|nr:phosphoglycolate phosphatase [Massilia eurypsychrophila]PIL46793.1 phosphoglycolate phosphatase [Massilia eurypsychrophila]
MGTGARSVLIDLDGTLVDTAPDIVEAAGRMVQALGAAPLPFKTVRGFIGNGVPTLVRRVLAASAIAPAVDEQHAQRLFHRHYEDTNGRFGKVFPGVFDGLDALLEAGYRLGCVTNKPRSPTGVLLAMTGLAPYFEVVVAGDSIAQMKPHPEPLLHACREMGADPALCVLVGDSSVDVAAALAALMPVFVVRYGYPGPDGHAGMRGAVFIDSLAEMPALLAAPARCQQTWRRPATDH